MAAPTGTRLQGKVAIVTGGSSGYGLGITHRFAAESATVIIADINAPPAGVTNDTSIFYHETNVAKAEPWKALIDFATSKFGKVDILVNNAGTSYKNKPTLEVTESDFDTVFLINVKSIYFSIPAFIPPLIAANRPGSIINIASTGAIRPRPGLVWYNATKGAVANATKGLAAEYGPHQIRVNAICPLLGATGLFEKFTGMQDTEENRKKFLWNVPMGRLCEPGDVADAALWFASEESRFVTGTLLEVDGGKCIG